MAEPTDYKATLNLPQTAFGMKANLAQLEPKLLARWAEQGLYEKILAHNAAGKRFSIQREEFKRLGVLARWDAPYLTMAFGYEAQTVCELAKFVRAGVVYRGKKPVHWCMSDQTALAEAEVEYEDHTSPTIYVA